MASSPKKPVLQMICNTRAPDVPGPPVTTMTAAEAPDMIALTDLVFPGFFRPRTLEMGSYLGIYDGLRLAAMAGERMRLDGYRGTLRRLHASRLHRARLCAAPARNPLQLRIRPRLHALPARLCGQRARDRRLPQDELRRPHRAVILGAAPVIAIETGRLALHEFDEGDADFVLRLLNEPSFLRFIGDRGVRTLADARKYIADGPVAGYARYGHGLLRVVRKSDGVALGMCGVLKRDTLPDPDIGFSFFPEHDPRATRSNPPRPS